jgi:cytochrome c-type biogenesis protein CcmH
VADIGPKRRLVLPVVAALLALGGVVALVLLRQGMPPSSAEVAHQIAADLRCPDCQGLSVSDSSSGSAVEIRRQIDVQLAAGRSPDEVRQSFVDRYGEWILLRPTAILVWLVPFLAVAAGLVVLLLWLMRRRRVRDEASGVGAQPVDEAQRARVHDEAEALDA